MHFFQASLSSKAGYAWDFQASNMVKTGFQGRILQLSLQDWPQTRRFQLASWLADCSALAHPCCPCRGCKQCKVRLHLSCLTQEDKRRRRLSWTMTGHQQLFPQERNYLKGYRGGSVVTKMETLTCVWTQSSGWRASRIQIEALQNSLALESLHNMEFSARWFHARSSTSAICCLFWPYKSLSMIFLGHQCVSMGPPGKGL